MEANKMEDYSYFQVVEELKEISSSIKELKSLVKQQIKIDSMNNILLKKICYSKDKSSNNKEIEDREIEKYINKNLLFINKSKDEAIYFLNRLRKINDSKVVISDAKTPGELASIINGCKENDIIFLDITERYFDEKMLDIVYHCIKDKRIYIPRGQGDRVNIMELEISCVNFIIYTYTEEILTKEIKDILTHIR